MVGHGSGLMHRVCLSAFLVALLISIFATAASARIRSTPRSPDLSFENSIGVGASYSPFMECDADMTESESDLSFDVGVGYLF